MILMNDLLICVVIVMNIGISVVSIYGLFWINFVVNFVDGVYVIGL